MTHVVEADARHPCLWPQDLNIDKTIDGVRYVQWPLGTPREEAGIGDAPGVGECMLDSMTAPTAERRPPALDPLGGATTTTRTSATSRGRPTPYAASARASRLAGQARPSRPRRYDGTTLALRVP